MSKTRVTYATASPYTDPAPEISASVETDLLQLLRPLLESLGEYRKRQGSISKGAGRRKKRKIVSSVDGRSKDDVKESDRPDWVKIGFNSVVRELETLATCSGTVLDGGEGASRTAATRRVRPAAVIACPAAIPAPFLNALPLLVALASQTGDDSDQPIRLVGVSSHFETAVSKAVLLPRVGVMALYPDSEGSEALINYVRNEVPVLKVTWLEQARSSSYLPLKLQAVNVPEKSKKRNRTDDGQQS
ncbi:hypothetical protein DV735_g5586, partial [Chaetothyriales sp. CBS 134920]